MWPVTGGATDRSARFCGQASRERPRSETSAHVEVFAYRLMPLDYLTTPQRGPGVVVEAEVAARGQEESPARSADRPAPLLRVVRAPRKLPACCPDPRLWGHLAGVWQSCSPLACAAEDGNLHG